MRNPFSKRIAPLAAPILLAAIFLAQGDAFADALARADAQTNADARANAGVEPGEESSAGGEGESAAATRDRAGALLLHGKNSDAAELAAKCLAGSTGETAAADAGIESDVDIDAEVAADCAMIAGRARFETGDLDGAVEVLASARGKVGPLEAHRAKLLGEALLLSGHAVLAGDALRAAVTLDATAPVGIEAAALLADALYDAGDMPGAAAQALTASELAGQPIAVRAGLSWTRAKALAAVASALAASDESNRDGAKDANRAGSNGANRAGSSAANGSTRSLAKSSARASLRSKKFSAKASASKNARRAGVVLAAQTAAEAAREFWRDFPDHPAAAEEPALESQLAAIAGGPLPEPSGRDRLARANRFLSAGIPAHAVEEAQAARAVLEGDDRAEASLLLARSLAADGRRSEAGPILEEAVRSTVPHVAAQAMLLLARDRSRRAENDAAIALLDQLSRRFPDSSEADEGAGLAARLLLDEGKPGKSANGAGTIWPGDPAKTEEGKRRLARIASKHNASGADARWTLAWLAYRENRPDAAELFAACAALATDDDSRAREIYWQARASGKALAGPLYHRALELDPLGWYGLLARAILEGARAQPSGSVNSQADTPSIAPDSSSNPRDSSSDTPSIAANDSNRSTRGENSSTSPLARAGALLGDPARRLLRIGYSSEADAELDRAAQAHRGDIPRLLPMLWGYREANRIDRSVMLAEQLLSGRPAPLEFREPERAALGAEDTTLRALLDAAYPEAYPDAISSAARRAGIDPHLILSVARRESVFKPDARSAAGAVGLLQLLPITARRAATVLGRPAPSDADLLDPEVAIDLGAWYLADLIGRFGDPAIAVAAYNAGPRAVAPWAKENAGEPLDIWVEEIPYKETRRYVKIVIGAWSAYRLLAGEAPPGLAPLVPEPGSGTAF